MKEFIEIPFGAKDSELGGWEYNIPEGYIASIENGKIIVKKEESEDEKIRKELLDFFDADSFDCGLETEWRNGIKYKDILAWLEKQDTDISSFPKEQQVFMRKYVSLDKITLIKLLAERDANNAEIIESFEKQGEQNKWKPSKDEMDALYGLAYMTNKMDDKKDEAITKLYQDLKREFFDGASYENMFSSSPVDTLIKDEKQGEQKPTDEEMKILLQTEYEKGKADAIEQNPAWSEEDDYNIERLFCILNNEQDNYPQISRDFQEIEGIKNWLNSFKERYTWKPSEEELNALDIAKDRNDKTGWHLCKLYKQLKKL